MGDDAEKWLAKNDPTYTHLAGGGGISGAIEYIDDVALEPAVGGPSEMPVLGLSRARWGQVSRVLAAANHADADYAAALAAAGDTAAAARALGRTRRAVRYAGRRALAWVECHRDDARRSVTRTRVRRGGSGEGGKNVVRRRRRVCGGKKRRPWRPAVQLDLFA